MYLEARMGTKYRLVDNVKAISDISCLYRHYSTTTTFTSTTTTTTTSSSCTIQSSAVSFYYAMGQIWHSVNPQLEDDFRGTALDGITYTGFR